MIFVDFWGTSVYYSDYQNGIKNPFYIAPVENNQNIEIEINSSLSQSVDGESNDIIQPSIKDNKNKETSKESNSNAVVSSNSSKIEENINSEEKTGSDELQQSNSQPESTPIENSDNETVLNDETDD